MTFGEQLIQIMTVDKLTERQVAEKTGFSEYSIWRYLHEESTPRHKDAIDILDSLGYEFEICKKKKHKDVPLHRNGSGYSDHTACVAIKHADSERERLTRLLDVIFAVCDMADFHVEGRIELLDRRTGKVWK